MRYHFNAGGGGHERRTVNTYIYIVFFKFIRARALVAASSRNASIQVFFLTRVHVFVMLTYRPCVFAIFSCFFYLSVPLLYELSLNASFSPFLPWHVGNLEAFGTWYQAKF